MITVDGLEKDVYINIQEIEEDAVNLLKNELVEFDQVKGKLPGSYAANNLVRINKRYTGVVLSFEDGKGIVKCSQNNEEYSLYYKDFVNTDLDAVYDYRRVNVESGDEIEFDVEEGGSYGDKAVRIYHDGRKPLERFAILPSWNDKIADLAKMSPEPWDYLSPEGHYTFLPVLSNYLFYTFARLRKEERLYSERRIAFATAQIPFRDKTTNKTSRREIECSCFNTGLATTYQEEIFAYFVKNTNKKSRLDPEWILWKFTKASDSEMSQFAEKPEWANYFREMEDKSEILYDTTLHHELKYDHILRGRQDRFPEELKALPDSVLKDLLDQGLDKARKRVRRNYKAAVPQYYNGKLQLLLPLSLLSQDRADLALAVEKEGKRYISRTVLKLEWAYSNARLLAKPDREWLNPVKDSELSDVPAAAEENEPVRRE